MSLELVMLFFIYFSRIMLIRKK